MVGEYLALRNRLKHRNRAKRIDTNYRKQYLEKTFTPITKTSKEAAEKMAKELGNINNTLANPARNIAEVNWAKQDDVKRAADNNVKDGSNDEKEDEEDEDEEEEEEEEEGWEAPYDFGPLSEKFLDTFKDEKARKKDLDTTFGLRKEGETWKIGSKIATVGPDDFIHVGDVTFPATPGFWSLVTDKEPRDYTSEDLSLYKELLYETDALYDKYDPSTHYPRSSGSYKWTTVLGPIWREFRKSGVVVPADNLDESGYDADTSRIIGEGIKMYMQKDGISYDLKKTRDGAMHISPRPNLTGAYGDGLYLRSAGSGIVHREEGRILGPNSPFKNIPILGWVL